MSKPAFMVEVSKGGNKKLAIHCAFPSADEYPTPAEHEPGDPYGWSVCSIAPALFCCFAAFMSMCLHRESKKQDTKLLPITSPNINQFSTFFHF